ncbi:hypothetical protein [Halalkalibacter alkalisediminis]|uniref:Uncharacterized protein n=1 Tax=Halalkalibacter alkalisediminis TaxID=935616 RepID=A0ABV6NAA7_9BACI|nr:hypothetical protein [Halalkalibacter alkalisediminis]
MTRISKSGRVRAERIQSSYVNRLTEAGGVNKIQHIQRIEKLKNPTNHPSENQLLSFERYYQTIREAKKEFKHYYKHEKDLYEAVLHLEEHGKRLFTQLEDFVQKYNKALVSLQHFDTLAGTEHVTPIYETFRSFSEAFHSIGIKKNKNDTLSYNPYHLQEAITHSRESVSELIDQFKEAVVEQYQTLVKVNKQSPHQTVYHSHPIEIKGLIIEEEG